jgi:hypothetical protein
MYKTPNEALDAYHKIRKQRLAAEGVARKLKVEEDAIEEWIIANFDKGKEFKGRFGAGHVEDQIKYVMISLDLLFTFAHEKGNPHFLISRINEKTCREWQAVRKKAIPGVAVVERPVFSFRSF